MKKIVILGAGITGLATGWFLKQKFGDAIKLSIFEQSERVGGWIRTFNEEGFRFEAGPRAFRSVGRGAHTLALAHALGLENELVIAGRDAGRRFIGLNDKLHQLSFPFLLKQGLLKGVWRDLWTRPSSLEDETIAAFGQRHGGEHLTQIMLDPVTKGIFGGSIEALSIRSCLPSLWELDQKYGSLVRGMLKKKNHQKEPAYLYTFAQGMETLPHALAARLTDEIVLNKRIESLHDIEADLIISTLPTHSLAKMMGYGDPTSGYATLTLVHLGWHEKVLHERGFGFLLPSIENEVALGMTWDSEIFPQGNKTCLCVMINGSLGDSEAIQRGLHIVQKYLKVQQPPAVYKVTVAPQAIPQYTVGHHKRMAEFQKRLPGHVRAIGMCFAGAGVNDAIYGAQHLVDALAF